MPSQGWNQTLVTQRTAGTLFNTYTTAKTVINQQDLFGFYANYFQLGTKLRVTVHAALSTLITTPGTVTFQIMLGTIVVWTSGAIQMNAVAHVLLPMKLVVDLTCQLTNTSAGGVVAKLMGQGVLTGSQFTTGSTTSTDSWGVTPAPAAAAVSHVAINVPVTLPALGTAFDSTISQTLDFWTGFSISNAANGIQVAQYDVEALNMPAS